MGRCSYEWLLVCMKVSVESCSLFLLADGYEGEKKMSRKVLSFLYS